MKKLLLIFAIALVSCSKDDDQCTCTAKYTDANNIGHYYYVPNTPIDCQTRQPLKVINPNSFFCGCN